MTEPLSERMREFEEATAEFVNYFELVFNNDWDFTRANIEQGFIESDGGTTFIDDDDCDGNNWGNRYSLLSAYRHLLTVLKKNSVALDPNFFDGEQP